MKKYLYIALASIAVLFTACRQDLPELTGEGEQNVTISVSVPNQAVATRAGSTEFADPTLSGMRVALIISTEDNKVVTVTTTEHSFGSGSTACSFETRLYKGKTYNISVWADFGATYYTIPTQPETEDEAATTLPVVKMASTTITGSNNNYDAYYGNVTQAISGNENINVTLTRPFALVKVNTTDWNENAIKLGYRPDNYTTSFETPTQLNLVSGVADSTQVITTSAAIVAYDKDSTLKELHYDYLFANTTSSILPDFEVSYKQGTTENSSYVFENIPVQRNYQTNITGNIFTKKGNITVTINPLWKDTVYEIEVKDIEEANKAITANAGKGKIVINFTTEPNDAGEPSATTGAKAILTTPLQEKDTLNINVQSETKQLYVGDYESETSTTIASGTNPAVVNITATGSIGTLVINAPSKTVYINGQQVTSVGTIANIDAITSNNTLVIEANQTVTNLTVRKGALEIHGTVTNAIVDTTGGNGPVYVRACEGLSQSVYDVLAPYIDVENGYAGVQNGSLWDIKIVESNAVAKIGETKYYTLAAAFETVKDGETIELLKNCSLTASTTIDKSVTLDLSTYTLTNACSGYAFDLNATETGKTFKITGTDASNCGHIVSNGTEGHKGLMAINGSAITFEMDYVKVHGATEDDAYVGTANINNEALFNDYTSASDIIKLNDCTVKTTSVILGGNQTHSAAASLNISGGSYTGAKGFRYAGTEKSVIDGATITVDQGIALYPYSDTNLKNSFVYDNATGNLNHDAISVGGDESDLVITNTTIESVSKTAVATENLGKATIESGTFSSTCTSNYGAALRCNTSGGTIVVNGGTIDGSQSLYAVFSNTKISQYSNAVSTITINGGTIKGGSSDMGYVSGGKAYVEINGGTFTTAVKLFEGNTQWVRINTGCTATFNEKVTGMTGTTAVTIPAGTFKKAIENGDFTAGASISGGLFYEAAPYSSYIAEGYMAVLNEGTPETWTVTEDAQ